MSWFYESDGKQCGPVSDAELEDLFRRGQVFSQTLVWREGMADWQPLAIARPPTQMFPQMPAQQPSLAMPTGARCAECGRTFPPDELISLNRSLVCAQCKPIFLQRMAEGAPSLGVAGLWREGGKLVTASETPFPDRCVKCNAPAHGFRLKRVLYWQHPAYYLLLFCNLLIMLIVILIVRKKAVLHIGLCEHHRQQRKIAIAICTVGMIGGFAMLIGGLVNNIGWVATSGIALFLFGLIWGIARGRTIAATNIDGNTVWVSGVCREFLDQLPNR
ncbi:MAG TPA: DUF4339 domain-containing protein [Verrucomicrobiae bacterium]